MSLIKFKKIIRKFYYYSNYYLKYSSEKIIKTADENWQKHSISPGDQTIKWIHEKFLNKKKQGYFIELGAYTGVNKSHTYILEKFFDWSGICIEPNDYYYEILKRSRSCICVNECIDGEEMRIIVAGPGPTKLHFIERLSKRAKEQVIAVEDIDFDAQNEIDIIRRFIKLAKKDEGEKEIHYIEKLRKEMMSGNLAALGVYEVLDAAASGRIQSVLILEGYQQAGMKCEPCQFYMKKQKLLEQLMKRNYY